MRSWHRALLGALLVGAVAAAGIALNFTLLRLTQDAHDPVGKLSPRVVFSGSQTTTLPGSKDDGGSQPGATTPSLPAGEGDRDD